MKKKIYFISASIIQLLVGIYLIVVANSIIQAQVETFNSMEGILPIELQSRIVGMLQKNGVKFIDIFSIIGIICNIITLKISIKDNMARKKGSLMAFSVIEFLTSNHIILTILPVINFVVAANIKRINPEDYPNKEKDKIPELEHEKATKKEIIWAILLIALYLVQFPLGSLLVKIENPLALLSIILIYYVALFVASIIIFRKRLKRDFKLLKNNFSAYIKFIFPKMAIMYLIYFSVNILVSIVTKSGVSVNQQELESLPILLTVIMSILWAPIVEECIYRGALRRIINNKVTFIIISAIIFGLAHSMIEETLLNVIIKAIPYAILGGFLAYTYTKTENITTNMMAHAINNIMAVALMCLYL